MCAQRHIYTQNKKAELTQRWPRDAPYIYGCPENFRKSLITPTATFPEIFNSLCSSSDQSYECATKFEVRSFTHS